VATLFGDEADVRAANVVERDEDITQEYRLILARELLVCVSCAQVMSRPVTDKCGHAYLCEKCRTRLQGRKRPRNGARLGELEKGTCCPLCTTRSRATRGNGIGNPKLCTNKTLHAIGSRLFPDQVSEKDCSFDLMAENERELATLNKTKGIGDRLAYVAYVKRMQQSARLHRSAWLWCDCTEDGGPFPMRPFLRKSDGRAVAKCPRTGHHACSVFRILSTAQFCAYAELLPVR